MSSNGLLITVLSLLLMAFVSLAGYVYSKKQLQKNNAYFAAGRNVTTAFMTATFIAYAVGTGLIFSPAEMAYYDGLTAMLGYAVAISLVFFLFVPISGRIKKLIPQGNTIGEFVRVRYGKTMYFLVLFGSTIYLFCLLSANLIGVGIAFREIGGIPIYLGVLIIAVPVILYTTYGGLGASIFTNGLQTILLIPMLFVTALMAFVEMGGPGAIYSGLKENSRQSLEIFHPVGLEFAINIILAVSVAELLNQALWQRIYSAKDTRVAKKGLISAGLMTFPMTILAASFGLIALALKLDLSHPSVATALVAHTLLPQWASMIFVLVIVLAATSTASDALAAFSSLFSLDIGKYFLPRMSSAAIIRTARISTVVFGAGATLLAFRAPSILKLLLFADLVAAAAVVPVIAGLYNRKISGKAGATGMILGLVCGMPLYLMNYSLYSYVAALIVSSVAVIVGIRFYPANYDFQQLSKQIS